MKTTKVNKICSAYKKFARDAYQADVANAKEAKAYRERKLAAMRLLMENGIAPAHIYWDGDLSYNFDYTPEAALDKLRQLREVVGEFDEPFKQVLSKGDADTYTVQFSKRPKNKAFAFVSVCWKTEVEITDDDPCKVEEQSHTSYSLKCDMPD